MIVAIIKTVEIPPLLGILTFLACKPGISMPGLHALFFC